MAAVVSTTHAAAGSATTISFTGLTVTTGQTVLAYLTSRDNTGANYSSATWAGSAETADESANGTLLTGVQFHRIIFRGITGTSQTLAITLSAVQDDLEGWAIVLSDVNQTTSMGATDSDDSNTSGVFDDQSLSVTAASGDIVLIASRIRADVTGSAVVKASQTLLDGPQLTANGNTILLSSKTGSGTVTSGYTFDGTGFPAHHADCVVIQGTGGGASGVPRFTTVYRSLINN